MKKIKGLIGVTCLMALAFSTFINTRALDDEEENIDYSTVKYSSEDFETYEDYTRFKELFPERIDFSSITKETKANKTMKGKLEYTIKGLKRGNAIQKTYIASTYIYVLQNVGKYDSVLSRCTMNTEKKEAVFKDEMVLKDFGHGQTLEWYEHNGKPYFWIACTSTPKKPSEEYSGFISWSREVGRIQYKAGDEKNAKDITRLSKLNNAQPSGKSIGKIKRVESSLSSNRKNVLFCVEDYAREEKKEIHEVMYSIYDFSKLNKIFVQLESTSKKSISCDTNEVKGAAIKSFKGDYGHHPYPNASNQGVELADDDSIYMVAGNNKSKALPIVRKLKPWNSYSLFDIALNINNFNQKMTEIEGVHLKGDLIFFGIKTHDNIQQIYSIPKHAY